MTDVHNKEIRSLSIVLLLNILFLEIMKQFNLFIVFVSKYPMVKVLFDKSEVSKKC